MSIFQEIYFSILILLEMIKYNYNSLQMMKNYQKDSPRRKHSSSQQNIKQIVRQRSREKGSKVEYYMGPDLHLTKHFFFMTKQEKRMSTSIAVWNLCMLHGKRPAQCLIICESESQIYKILQFNRLNRKTAILADHDRRPLKQLIEKQQVQILLMTNKKASMLCALQEAINCFNLILNLAFHKDIQHYRKLHEFIQKTGGIVASFVNERRDLQKIERATSLNFVETTAQVTTEDINKQILGDIQFVSNPKPETYSVLKMLPYSSEQICARMFEILQSHATDCIKSKYLGLIGYITYQIKTEVQFNSYKYVWNFLKDLPEELSQSIKNMTKFKNGKGAVFNIPAQFKYEMDHYIRKLIKNHKDNKFEISIVYEMPEIEDIDSAQYKQMEQKKTFAMKNKKELQVFVGGLPFKAGQPEIRSFFLKNNVNPLTIRLMKDKEGLSKGICFVLCEDKEHVARALKLDESKFEDKIIRVHIAQKRENRWEH